MTPAPSRQRQAPVYESMETRLMQAKRSQDRPAGPDPAWFGGLLNLGHFLRTLGSPVPRPPLALALSAVATRSTRTAESPATSAKTAASRPTGTAEAATRTAGSSARPILAAKLALGTSGPARPARPAHHHEEIGLRILRQALAQAARDLEGLAAVLAIHRRRGGGRGLRCVHLALQLGFKLISAGLRAAYASHALQRRRFLQLQRKIDLRAIRAIRFLGERLEAEHPHFDGTIAGRRRGEQVMAALVGGGNEFPVADGGGDSRAGNGLVRRLDEAALGIQPSAGGEKRKEKKTRRTQSYQVLQEGTTTGDRQPLPVKRL